MLYVCGMCTHVNRRLQMCLPMHVPVWARGQLLIFYSSVPLVWRQSLLLNRVVFVATLGGQPPHLIPTMCQGSRLAPLTLTLV